MKTFWLYLIRRRWPRCDTQVRAYTVGTKPPKHWRARWIGTVNATSRWEAVLLIRARGWKGKRRQIMEAV